MQTLQFIFQLLTLAGLGFLIYRELHKELQLMPPTDPKVYDDLESAVSAIDDVTNVAAKVIDEQVKEIEDAAGNPARVQAASSRLLQIAAHLREVATRADTDGSATGGGGVIVPPVPDAGGVIIGGDGSTGGGSGETGEIITSGGSSSSPSGGGSSSGSPATGGVADTSSPRPDDTASGSTHGDDSA